MMRTSLLRTARHASRSVPRLSNPSLAATARYHTAPLYTAQSKLTQRSPVKSQAVRRYSAPAGLSKPEVEGRIIDLLKNFDKIKDASKLTGVSHFSKDLGLDSLDTVEVVMAIEEEFSIEIPDKEADEILSIEQAVNYILHQPDAH